MNGLGDFHFIRPLWLLLLPAVVGLWWIAISTSDALRGWRLIMDAELLAAMTVGRDRPQRIQHILPLVGWILAVIAIAGPTWRPEPSPFADDPAPVMILLRAGESMNRTDLAPSRMERARLKVADFAKLRKGQPMGLIAYAGSAHLVLPPTRDTSIVADMAAEISPDLMPAPGDNLEIALRLATRTLGTSGGSVVVVADTVEANRPDKLRKGPGDRVPVHFLAMARSDTPELAAINQAAGDLRADVVRMTADSDDIQKLAKTTARHPISVDAPGTGTRWDEAGWWIVPVLAILSLTTFRRIDMPDGGGGASMKSGWTLVATVVAITWSGLWFTDDQRAQRMLNRGDFTNAAQTFRDPMWQGVAWYRAGDFKKAEQCFARLATPEAEFNRGNALLMMGTYDQAVERYDRALALRPGWNEATINRGIAVARGRMVERKGGDMGDQKIGADEIRFDKSEASGGQETEVDGDQAFSDASMQAMWLRRVQTRPAEFLRAKFSYQQQFAAETGDPQ